MRVLHLCSEKSWRGGEQQVVYLVSELRKHDVHCLLAIKPKSFLEQYCRREDIPFYHLRFSNSLDFVSAYKVKRICTRERIDLIHTHTSVAHGVGVLAAALGNTAPIMVSRRVDFIPRDNFLTRWKYNHPRIKRIAGVSNKITGIMSRYVRDPSKCVTIYSGIDLGRFASSMPNVNVLREEFRVHPVKKLIGNTSALADHKDYFTFIDTIEQVINLQHEVHGFIIGDGPLQVPLKDYVLRKGLQHVITFTGFRTDVPSLLPCLDAFLMTSKEEGLGTSLLDAFIAGIPVVATRAGGIPEIVQDGVTGLTARVGDSEELARSIIRILQDRTTTNYVIRNAWAMAGNFTKERMALQTLKEYQSILKK